MALVSSGIELSRLDLSNLSDPQAALSAIVKECKDALWRYINLETEHAVRHEVLSPIYENLKGVMDLEQVLSALTAAPGPKGVSDDLKQHAAVLQALSGTKRRIERFLIALNTFCDIGKRAPSSIGFREWDQIRGQAFELIGVLEEALGR